MVKQSLKRWFLKPCQGFTLLELVLATSLAGVVSLAGVQLFSQVSGQLNHIQNESNAKASFYHLGHWLWRELMHAQQPPIWHGQHQCLLFADNGVRVAKGTLQWRPQGAACHSARWQSLHDPGEFQINRLTYNTSYYGEGVTPFWLCLEGETPTRESLEWCYSGDGGGG